MFFLKKKIKRKIDRRVSEYCYHELQKVVVKPKYGIFNNQCYENAVDYASRFPGTEVVMGFYSHKDHPETHLHFWCRRDDKDFDVSVGYFSRFYSYHEIRIVKESDWGIIGNVFNDGLEYYRDKFTNPIERFLINYGRIV